MKSSPLHARVGRSMARELHPIRTAAQLPGPARSSNGSKGCSWRRKTTGSNGMQVLRVLTVATRLPCVLAWLGHLIPASRAAIDVAKRRPAQRTSDAC